MGGTLNDSLEIAPGQPWDVYRFEPGDAEGVARLFISTYGAGYPIRAYVEPERLIAENEANRIISVVAKTPSGDIVGHGALFNSASHPGTYEAGAGVVHSAYRGGKGIFTRMTAFSLTIAETLPGVNAVFGEPVCNHPFSQKMCVQVGFATRALEVDLMPAAAYLKEGSASGRVAAFLDFKTIRPKPHAVYLPVPYLEDLRFCYEGLDDERTFEESSAPIPASAVTDIRWEIFDFAGVARITVHNIGTDFSTRMDEIETELKKRSVTVHQVWLNLSAPWVGKAVEALRNRGYFFGGPLPRWFDTDGMLMQKINKRPDWVGICFVTDRAAKILEIVRLDWERSQKEERDGN